MVFNTHSFEATATGLDFCKKLQARLDPALARGLESIKPPGAYLWTHRNTHNSFDLFNQVSIVTKTQQKCKI